MHFLELALFVQIPDNQKRGYKHEKKRKFWKLTANTPGTHLKKVLNILVRPVFSAAVPLGDVIADGGVRLEVDEAVGVVMVEAGDKERVEWEGEESVGDLRWTSEDNLV